MGKYLVVLFPLWDYKYVSFIDIKVAIGAESFDSMSEKGIIIV